AVELGAACGSYVPAAKRAFKLFDLRLARVEEHYALQIRQSDSLIAKQHRNRSAANRGSSGHALIFIRATDIDRQVSKSGREDIRRDSAEDTQIHPACDLQTVMAGRRGGHRALQPHVGARAGELSGVKTNFVGPEVDH